MFVAEATSRDFSVAHSGDAMARGLDFATIRSTRRRPSGA